MSPNETGMHFNVKIVNLHRPGVVQGLVIRRDRSWREVINMQTQFYTSVKTVEHSNWYPSWPSSQPGSGQIAVHIWRTTTIMKVSTKLRGYFHNTRLLALFPCCTHILSQDFTIKTLLLWIPRSAGRCFQQGEGTSRHLLRLLCSLMPQLSMSIMPGAWL